MLTAAMRTNAEKWFSTEFNRNYKNKFNKVGGAAGGDDDGEAPARHLKRHKTSTAGFFAESDEEDSADEVEEDELKAYLALPQIKFKTEKDAFIWWQQKEAQFPNVAVMGFMARQYLGCPASSAAVERLFSRVGIAFSAKRRSAESDTLADIMFAQANLP